jgi:inhibitor of KinA sporulation pathway (predicted exonuclease)
MQRPSQLEDAIATALNAGKTKEEILKEVGEIVEQFNNRSLTQDDIEKRNYTMVQACIVDKTDHLGMRFESFLVSSPWKVSAVQLAQAYAKQQNWDVKSFSYHPRTYYRKAKQLFAENKFI